MLDREHLARAREATLDFISNQNDSMLVADRPEAAHEFERCDIEAALSLYGFDDDRCDARRFDVGMEELIERCERLLYGHAVIGDRERRMKNLRNGPKPTL